mgnify:CR=1 FL=1
MGTFFPQKRIILILSALAFVTFGAALLCYPVQIRENVTASVLYCLSSLVPSLFPFMVLASFGVRSGAGEILGQFMAPVTRYVFRLPKICGATLLLSFFGGYPAGARGISLLLEEGKITSEQAGRMMTFCVAPGAAFVVTFLGCGVLDSLSMGWLLFFSITLSGLLLGFFTGLGKPLPEEPGSTAQPEPAGQALIRSISDASSATVKMCGCILLFAGFTAILRGSGIFQTLAQLISSTGLLDYGEVAVCLSFLLEVTGGTGDAALFGAGPLLYAFGLAFGGLCVHMQVFSFFSQLPLSKGKFFLYRFLHGILSAGLCFLLGRFLPLSSQPVWAAASQPVSYGTTASTAAGGLSLLLMCMAFLLFVTQRSQSKKP